MRKFKNGFGGNTQRDSELTEYQSITKTLRERLWNDGDLGTKIDIREASREFFGDNDSQHVHRIQHYLCAMRRKLEKYTGYILSCDHGIYQLLPTSEIRKIDEEMDKRQLRLERALLPYKRVVKHMLINKTKATPYIRAKVNELRAQIDKLDVDRLLLEAQNDETKRARLSIEEVLQIES